MLPPSSSFLLLPPKVDDQASSLNGAMRELKGQLLNGQQQLVNKVGSLEEDHADAQAYVSLSLCLCLSLSLCRSLFLAQCDILYYTEHVSSCGV